MNKFLKTLPVLALGLSLALVGVHEYQRPIAEVHAQGMIPDQAFGFSGNLTNVLAQVVTATTTASRVGGPASITAASARFHVKCIHVTSPTSGVVSYYEHPTSGSDIFICNIGVIANTPTTIRQGTNEVLGLNGYLSAPGSSIKAAFNNNTPTTITHTLTASLE